MMRPRLGADGAPQEGFGAPARLPNLILIVIDALRPDHLGAYGYERPTSPNIDALAERGWRFRFAMAPSSWTLPSIGALFTSLHPSEHRGVSVEHRVRADVPTLAGLLRAAGYQTVGVTASFMHMSEDSGVARGFDSWSSPSIGLGDERGGSVSSAGQSDDRHSRALTGQELNVEVFDRLPKPRSQPLFLFVHYMDPHAPYAPGEPHRSVFARDRAVHDLRGVAEDDYLVDLANGSSDASYDERRWLVDLYDAEIAQVDAAVGSLIDELEQRGWLEESVIALVADHGEELGEHGGWLHGRTLQRESLFVPMIFVDTRRPGARGRRLERVDLLDVPTTLLAAAGVAPGRHMRGRRLLTEWEILPRGLVAQLHADPFSESSAAPRSQRFALTAWPWRSILRADGSLAIYDLRTDPMESAPMGRNQSKELRRVTAATDRIVGRLAPRRAAPPRAPVDSTPAEAPRAE
jgi:arylsulfatase